MTTVPLVGMHFRPPAKILLSVMPNGAEVEFRPEPENPYDPDAIAVWANASSIKPEHLLEKQDLLEGCGNCPNFLDPDELQEWIETDRHLGYVARTETSKVFEVATTDADGNLIMPSATLGFAMDGKPLVSF